MGSDLSVVNAARVSFHKESKGEKVWDNITKEWGVYPTNDDHKLIWYLARNNHWSPFAHAFLSFRIKAPIFVARQLAKHQVGLAWNEVSRRYVDDEPEFYVPDAWRKRAENVKQGSSDEVVGAGHSTMFNTLWDEDPVYYSEYTDLALRFYNALLDKGVAPEQARMVLPQSTMTEWIWSGSLAAFARVCKLRLDPHAQKECRDVVEWIAVYVKQEFPVSFEALMET
jgi:thymidylate synthase (FAD)